MSETLAAPLAGAGLLSGRRNEGTRSSFAVKSPDNLSQLVLRLQRKDDTALEPLIQQTQETAYRLAFSFLQDAHLCQDVLQEVYLTVFQKIDQLRDPSALKSWLAQIVVNQCRQHLRLRSRTDLGEIPEQVCSEPITESVETRLDVHQALKRLNAQDQTILTLREVLELSYQDIADSLQVPLGTVRSRLANARARLCQLFRGKEPRQ